MSNECSGTHAWDIVLEKRCQAWVHVYKHVQWSLAYGGGYVLKITRSRRNPRSSQLLISASSKRATLKANYFADFAYCALFLERNPREKRGTAVYLQPGAERARRQRWALQQRAI